MSAFPNPGVLALQALYDSAAANGATAATGISRLAEGAARSEANQGIGILLGPANRKLNQSSNLGQPQFPSAISFSDLLKLYYGGRLDQISQTRPRASLDYLLGVQGIFTSPRASGEAADTIRQAWHDLVDLSRPFLPVGQLIDAWRSGRVGIDRGYLEGLLKRNGIYDDVQQHVALDLQTPPSASTVMRWYFQGLLTENECRDFLKWAGVLDTTVVNTMLASRPPVPTGLVSDMTLRGLVGPDYLTSTLKMHGWATESIDKIQRALTEVMPTLSDAIKFQLRNTTDDRMAALLDLDSDAGPVFAAWARDTGYNWNPEQASANAPSLAAQLWRASRALPGAGVAAEMLFRLRPGRLERYADAAGPPDAFTTDQYDALLKAAGIPSQLRKWTKAISHPVLQQRYLVQGVQLGVVDLGELREQYLDHGFLPSDADIMVKVAEARAKAAADKDEAKLQSAARSSQLKSIESLYVSGALARPQALTAILNLGVSVGVAEVMLDAADAASHAKLISASVSATRQQYLRGEIDPAGVLSRLGTIGFSADSVHRLLLEWNILLTPKRKELATADILKGYEHGFIPEATALQRLVNLGWSEPDAVLHMAEAHRTLAMLLAQQQAAAQRAASAQGRALEAIAAAHQKAAADALKKAEAAEPLRDLKKFYHDGVITAAELEQRMTQYGYSNAFIAWTVKDLQSKPAKQPKPKPPRKLTEAQLGKALKKGIITESQYTAMLKDAGYTQQEIDLLKEGA